MHRFFEANAAGFDLVMPPVLSGGNLVLQVGFQIAKTIQKAR